MTHERRGTDSGTDSALLRDMPCRRVLIIEPNRGLRNGIGQQLVERHYEVSYARDGKTALEVLMEETLPDVILLELDLPAASGWKFLALQKSIRRISAIPTLVFSKDGKHRGLYAEEKNLEKTAHIEELLDSLDRLCANREDRARRTQRKATASRKPQLQLEFESFRSHV